MYDSDQTAVTEALTSANPTVFSQATIDQILALASKDGNAVVSFDTVTPDADGNVSVPAGTEIVYVNSSDDAQTTVTPPANAPVVIFQGRGGVVATLNDAAASVPGSAGTPDRVVVGTAGNDHITVLDSHNTKVILGSGDSSVTAGQGFDTIEAGLGNSSVVGSGKYDVVKLAGAQTNYTVTVNNGHAVVTDNTTAKVTDISKIQYVQLDNGNALVFAKDSAEGQVSILYHSLFGRDADAGGLNFWFDAVKAGATLNQVGNAFTQSSEATAMLALDDTAYIQTLYQNTFGRAGEDAGVAYWADALAHGSTRGDVLTSFAQIAIQSLAHTDESHEAVVVGENSLHIITGII